MKNIQQLTTEQTDIKDRIKKVELSLMNLKDNNSLLLDFLPIDLAESIKIYCEELLNTDLDFQKQTDTELTLYIDGLVDEFIQEQLKEDLDIKNYEIKLKEGEDLK